MSLEEITKKPSISRQYKPMLDKILAEIPFFTFDCDCPFYNERKDECTNPDSYCYESSPKYRRCVVNKGIIGNDEIACTTCGITYNRTIRKRTIRKIEKEELD